MFLCSVSPQEVTLMYKFLQFNFSKCAGCGSSLKESQIEYYIYYIYSDGRQHTRINGISANANSSSIQMCYLLISLDKPK